MNKIIKLWTIKVMSTKNIRQAIRNVIFINRIIEFNWSAIIYDSYKWQLPVIGYSMLVILKYSKVLVIEITKAVNDWTDGNLHIR